MAKGYSYSYKAHLWKRSGLWNHLVTFSRKYKKVKTKSFANNYPFLIATSPWLYCTYYNLLNLSSTYLVIY